MSHGNLKVQDGKLIGEIRTRRVHEKFWLVGNTRPVGQKPATHIIMARSASGHEFQAGIAWQHKIERGEFTGQNGYFLLFNDPDYGQSMGFGAYPTGRPGEWELSLKNDKPAVATETQAATAAA